jgi:hypothetical protein
VSSEEPHGGEPGEDRGKIFISYRREDAELAAGFLWEGLSAHFGAENVFLDTDAIKAGSDWLKQIRANVASAGTFLAVIGPGWLSAMQQRNRSDADASKPDEVMREIELALQKGSSLQIIPVLVNGAAMPAEGQLPNAVQPLAGKNAHRMGNTPAAWKEDLKNLIEHLESGESPPATAQTAPGPPPSTRPADPVLEQLFDGTLVPILGSGVNAGGRLEPWAKGSGSLPNARELAGALAERFEIEEERFDLAETAQSVYVKDGDAKLYKTLKQFLAPEECEPGAVHRFLAELPKLLEEQAYPTSHRHQMIVTTNYDAALERAFKACNEPYDVAMYMATGHNFLHIPWEGEPTPVMIAQDYKGFPFFYNRDTGDLELERTLIVKTYGDVDWDEGRGWSKNYVITEDHYIDYLSSHQAEVLVPRQILNKLRDSQCLFLGYPMHAWSLRVFLAKVWDDVHIQKPSFAVEREIDDVEQRLWEELDVELIISDVDAYVSALKERLIKRDREPQAP